MKNKLLSLGLLSGLTVACGSSSDDERLSRYLGSPVGLEDEEEWTYSQHIAPLRPEIIEIIRGFPITENTDLHRNLFYDFLNVQRDDHRLQVVNRAKSFVSGTVHPFDFYKFLKLASYFQLNPELEIIETTVNNPHAFAAANNLRIKERHSFLIEIEKL